LGPAGAQSRVLSACAHAGMQIQMRNTRTSAAPGGVARRHQGEGTSARLGWRVRTFRVQVFFCVRFHPDESKQVACPAHCSTQTHTRTRTHTGRHTRARPCTHTHARTHPARVVALHRAGSAASLGVAENSFSGRGVAQRPTAARVGTHCSTFSWRARRTRRSTSGTRGRTRSSRCATCTFAVVRTLEGIIRTLSAISHNPKCEYSQPLVPSSMPKLECDYPYP
jgi:hypothetical protein